MNLKFWKRRAPVVASPAARESLGITDPDTQAYEAIKLALSDQQSPMNNLPYVPAKDITAPEVTTRSTRLAHLKKHGPTSEYHLALANGIVDDLTAEIAELESSIAEHEATSAEWVKKLQADIVAYQKGSAEKSAAMRNDVADKRKALAFWQTAPGTLGDAAAPPPPALPKPKRVRKPKAPAENPPA